MFTRDEIEEGKELQRPKAADLFKPGTQNFRIYSRLLYGPTTNVELVGMRILNYRGRVSEIRDALKDHLMDIKAQRQPDGSGVFIYSLRG